MNNLKLISVTVYVIVIIALAVTTFISSTVYGSIWFIGLWMLFTAVLITVVIATRMWRQAPRFLLHMSFIAILGGGLLTYLTQEKGSVRLSPGQTVSSFISDSGKTVDLPESVTLNSFNVVYYPGGIVPRDYVSALTIAGKRETLSMNKVLEIKGYRLLQASYDSSGATVLSVNYDPYGMPLAYAGYLMFAIGGIWLLINPHGDFRRLLRNLSFITIIIVCGQNEEKAASIDGVPCHVADSLRSQQVIYEGRVVCFNTLARDVVTKLYGKPSFRGLTPEQTLLSLRLFPDKWKNQPILKIKDKEIRKALGIDGQYASLSQLFDSLGNYRVENLYTSLSEKKRHSVEELDEKVGIVLSLYAGDLIVAPPADSIPLSPIRIKMELLYNSIPFTTIIFISLFCGFFLGMAGFFCLRKGLFFSRVLLMFSLALSVVCFIFQWCLSGHIPLANTFETLLLVVLVTEILILIITRHNNGLLLPLGMLMAGAMALVAHLVEMNPVVTPLMPVLHSPWLSLHVALVMTSYAVLGFTFINALAALLVKTASEKLAMLSEALLCPGVILLGLGIFTGAVWANVSWGQYWSWDPKENWALITMLAYAFPLHRSISFFNTPRNLHIYLLLAILTLLMTYFGVNNLNSMHAYN